MLQAAAAVANNGQSQIRRTRRQWEGSGSELEAAATIFGSTLPAYRRQGPGAEG